MPQVNVDDAPVVVVLEADRASGRLLASVINRGPDSAWIDIAEPGGAIVAGAGAGNACELALGESADVVLDRGEALLAICAATETARLDVLSSNAG